MILRWVKRLSGSKINGFTRNVGLKKRSDHFTPICTVVYSTSLRRLSTNLSLLSPDNLTDEVQKILFV